MQQGTKDPPAELQQPKKELEMAEEIDSTLLNLKQCEEGQEEIPLNPPQSEDKATTNQQNQIITETDFIPKQLENGKEFISDPHIQIKEENIIFDHNQATEKTISEQLKEDDKVLNNDPNQNAAATNSVVNHELEEEKEIINNQVVKKISSEPPQEGKEINKQSDQTEEEKNASSSQPEQKNQKDNSFEDQTKKVTDNPDQPTEGDKDSNFQDDFLNELNKNLEDENCVFEIIDLADYDPEFPTEDDVNISKTSAVDSVKPGTSQDITKEVITETNIINPRTGKKYTKAQKQKYLINLEKQIMLNKVNINYLPSNVWNFLKQLSGAERRKFMKTMREKLAKQNLEQNVFNRPQDSPSSSIDKMVKQGVINDLTSSLSQWLIENWGSMEVNPENMSRGKPFNDYHKRRFIRNLERMVDRNMVDLNNLPPKVWNSLKQLRWGERTSILKAMKARAAANKSQSGSGTTKRPKSPSHSQDAGGYRRSRSPSRKTSSEFGRSFGGATSQHQTSPNEGKTNFKGYGKLPYQSFDNFQTLQRPNEKSMANIATTSQVSPNNFAMLSHNRYSQNPGGSTFKNYTEPLCYPFKDNFQTTEDTRKSSDLFSYSSYGSSTKEGANRPSYYGGNVQSSSYNSVQYTGRESNFQTQNNGKSEKNPYRYKFSEDYAREVPDVYRDSYRSTNAIENRPRDDLKRKIQDSYNPHPPKRHNTGPSSTIDDSIKAMITDDSNPMGTLNPEQAALLSTKLVQMLDQISMSSQGHIPRFNNSGLLQGVFKITCADQKSFNWLRQTVANLPELWRGAKLHVGILTLFSTKRVKVNVYIPGLVDDLEVTFQRLERQNPGLNTGSWKIIRQNKNNRGKVFFLEIDEPSLQVLKKLNFKAFLGLSCIHFQMTENISKKMNKANKKR